MVSDKYLVINVTLSRRVKQKNHLSRNLYEFQPPGLRWVPGWHNLRLVPTSRFNPKCCPQVALLRSVQYLRQNCCELSLLRLRTEDLLNLASQTPFEASKIPTNPNILTNCWTSGYKLWRPVKCKETLNKAAVATTKCPLLENSCHRSLNGELRSVWATPDANQPSFLN